MIREIIFRAKQAHNGQWMEGYFSKDYAGVAYITTLDGVSTGVVDESTLGQYTGLTDDNGVKIFEGDVVECWDDSADDPGWGLDRRHTGVIEYASPSFSLAIKTRFPNSISRTASRHEIDGSYPNMKTYLDRWVNAENIEVIGNRFDNPELTEQA